MFRGAARSFHALVLFYERSDHLRNIGNIIERDDGRPIEVVSTEDVFFEIVYPPELEYTYRIRPAQDFGAPFNASFSERKIGLVPVEPQTGCRRPDNADKLAGRVALVWRGDCSFFLKTAIAEDAGAKAVIVADYLPNSIDEERESPLWMDHYYIEMASDNDIAKTRTVNIPAGFLLGKNGRMIKETLKRLKLQFAVINIPVNMTFAPLTEFHHPPWVVL